MGLLWEESKTLRNSSSVTHDSACLPCYPVLEPADDGLKPLQTMRKLRPREVAQLLNQELGQAWMLKGRALISSTQILLPIPFGMLCDTYEWMRLLFKGVADLRRIRGETKGARRGAEKPTTLWRIS